MARLLALLLGCSLGLLLAATVAWVRNRPEPTQDIELHVTDARGMPVERYSWSIWAEPLGAMPRIGSAHSMHLGGVANLSAPLHRISIEVEARGLHRTQLGPFEPDEIPARLDVMLADVKVIEGQVLFHGTPVSGAAVGLFLARTNDFDDSPAGLVYGDKADRCTTSENGSFRIASDWPYPYLVRAAKHGFASGTTGPVRPGDPPITIELPEGGAIDGRIVHGDQRQSEGAAVELYRVQPGYDDEASTFEYFVSKVGPSGDFRFEHIDTGPWLVRPQPATKLYEIDPITSLERVPYLVTIVEQGTAVVAMDLSQPPLKLTGRITLNGQPWSGAWPTLYTLGEKSLVLDRVESDSAGRWTLQVRAPGTYRLVINGNHKHKRVPKSVMGVIEIPQEGASFERDIQWDRTKSPVIQLERGR